MMADQHDITVRIPVEFKSPEIVAGWVQSVITKAMTERNWTGEPAVIWKNEFDQMCILNQGIQEGGFILPHGLYQNDEREDEPWTPTRKHHSHG